MSIFNKVTKTFQWGQQTVTLETGEIARQSGGAVIVNIADTVILATVVARKDAKPGQDFFPLTVDYIEKTYAAGSAGPCRVPHRKRPGRKQRSVVSSFRMANLTLSGRSSAFAPVLATDLLQTDSPLQTGVPEHIRRRLEPVHLHPEPMPRRLTRIRDLGSPAHLADLMCNINPS